MCVPVYYYYTTPHWHLYNTELSGFLSEGGGKNARNLRVVADVLPRRHRPARRWWCTSYRSRIWARHVMKESILNPWTARILDSCDSDVFVSFQQGRRPDLVRRSIKSRRRVTICEVRVKPDRKVPTSCCDMMPRYMIIQGSRHFLTVKCVPSSRTRHVLLTPLTRVSAPGIRVQQRAVLGLPGRGL